MLLLTFNVKEKCIYFFFFNYGVLMSGPKSYITIDFISYRFYTAHNLQLIIKYSHREAKISERKRNALAYEGLPSDNFLQRKVPGRTRLAAGDE